MGFKYRLFLQYTRIITKSTYIHKCHIKACYQALLLLAKLSHLPQFGRYFSTSSFMFRGFVHVLNVLNSCFATNDRQKFNESLQIKAAASDIEKRKYFFKNFVDYPPEVLDPEVHLLDLALKDSDFSAIYFVWSFNSNSFRYYTSTAEGEAHLKYLCNSLKKLNNEIEQLEAKAKLLTAQNLARFFRGTVNPSVNSDLKDFQILKMRLMKKCIEILEPDIKSVLAFSRKPGPLKKVGILRYSTELSEEMIQLTMIFSKAKQRGIEVVWLILNSEANIYESKDIGGRTTYHLPLSNFSKSVEYIRSLNLDLLVLGTPVSGKFLNEAAVLVQKRLATLQIAAVANVVSSGLENVDGFLLADIYDAKKTQKQLSEKIWRMPGCGVREHISKSENLPRRWFEAADGVHFVSNAHALKLGEEILSVWMKILAQSFKSKLILMPFGNLTALSFKEIFLRTLYRACAEHKIAKNRIVILEDIVGTKSVIEGLKQGHVFLDTFPYSGSTSLFDPLSIGQPVITLDHKYLRGMMGAAILRHTNRLAYIAESESEYIDLAVKLAQDKSQLLIAYDLALQAQESVKNDLNKNLEEEALEYLCREYEEVRAQV
jgi:predicted O-linked N-acetylglucosamine transferase (SPINDLY family)